MGNDSSSKHFDEQAKSWDSEDKIAMSAAIVAAMQRCVPFSPEMSVLDYGCGTGLIALALSPQVAAVDGMDTSTGMLEVMKQKADAQGIRTVRCLRKDLEQEELTEGPYDAIVTAMTLHHLSEPAGMIARFAVGLKPEGYLAIADLVQEDGSFHGVEREEALGVKHHGFDPDVVARWLREAGLRDVRQTIAHTIEKNDRRYPVFLVTGQR